MATASFRGPKRVQRRREISKLRRASGGAVEAQLLSLDVEWESLHDAAERPRTPIASVPAPADRAVEVAPLSAPVPTQEVLSAVLQSAWSEAQVQRAQGAPVRSSGEPPVRHTIRSNPRAASVICAPAARSMPARSPHESSEIGLPNERSSGGLLAIIGALALAAATAFIMSR